LPEWGAVAGAFFLLGYVYGNWVARIPAIAAATVPDGAKPASRAWTDDYSSLFALRRK